MVDAQIDELHSLLNKTLWSSTEVVLSARYNNSIVTTECTDF